MRQPMPSKIQEMAPDSANASKKKGPDPPSKASAPSAADVEDPPPGTVTAGDSFVAAVLMRWKREDFPEKGVLLLRALGCLFSLLSFIVMATNNHGGWMNFDHYDEYRYLLAISILAFLYCVVQVVLRLHRFSTGGEVVSARTATIVDFAGDQVTAYLLMSALSAAIPLTNNIRKGADNLFSDASSASISMAFFAFLSLALSAMISGYKLSKQTS